MMTTTTLAVCGLLYSLIATNETALPSDKKAAEQNVDMIITYATNLGQLDQVTKELNILSDYLAANPSQVYKFLRTSVPICKELETNETPTPSY